MEIEIGPASEAGRFTVRVVRSVGAGEPSTTSALDVDRLLADRTRLEDTVLASSVAARRVLPAHETSVQSVGSQLFDSVFVGPVREAYRTSVAVAQNRGQGVRLLLRFTGPGLAALPWEALYDREAGGYLCRKEPLLRQIGTAAATPALALDPPLRVLALIASPTSLPPIDVAGERARLLEALGSQVEAGWIHLDWVVDASWQRVHQKLLEEPWHVLHFIGHGSFDHTRDEGVLAFVGADGRADFVNASSFADLVHEASPSPRLVVLNACLTGAESTDDLFSGTAAALVRSGINAVAAMQFAISDQAALEFSRGFYLSLARGRAIDDAMRSGRIGILGVSRDTLEWVTPVLCVRGDDTRLFDLKPGTLPPVGQREQGRTHEAAEGSTARAVPTGARTTEPATTETVPTETVPTEAVPTEAVPTESVTGDAGSGEPAEDAATTTRPREGHEESGDSGDGGDSSEGGNTGDSSGGGNRDDRGRRRRVAAVVGSVAVLALGAAVAIAVLRPFGGSTGNPTGSPTVIESHAGVVVAGNEPWSDTGIDCDRGDVMHVEASGIVYHSSSRSSAVGPNGLTDPSYHKYNVAGLPDANTASLIGSLDREKPFFVGSEATFECDRAGRLFLGINDANLQTNSGAWSATIIRGRP